MSILELFSGTKSISNSFLERGHTVFTVDNNPNLQPDLCVDIMTLCPYTIPFRADVIWASPPCTTFSVASISHYWTNGKPKNEKSLQGIAILNRAIWFIKQTSPKIWFIENPRGMMRKVIDQLFLDNDVEHYYRRTVSYCQYGHTIMKPTDIWTNCREWIPKPICKPGAICHERTARGAKSGVQGISNPKWERGRVSSATARGMIPKGLGDEIVAVCESVV